MTSPERINQSELPTYALKDVLRLPRELQGQYAGKPTAPVDLALAVGIKPSSSVWRYITGATLGYGLTDGGYNSSRIGLTELGRRVVAPTAEGDDRLALREAALKPSVLAGFMRKYNGSKFPRPDIAKNVLQAEFGVPAKRAADAVEIIINNGTFVGFFREIGGDRYVNLETAFTAAPAPTPRADEDETVDEISSGGYVEPIPQERLRVEQAANRKVFVAHGRNRVILDQVKQLLELGDFEPEVAVEQETAAIPIPEKVFAAMRRCSAAIICVTADGEGDSQSVNENVLIEIGAAYILYDRRLILLWDSRVAVPSNLQGLYRCEFTGNELTWSAGTKVQKALLAFKRGEAPTE